MDPELFNQARTVIETSLQTHPEIWMGGLVTSLAGAGALLARELRSMVPQKAEPKAETTGLNSPPIIESPWVQAAGRGELSDTGVTPSHRKKEPRSNQPKY